MQLGSLTISARRLKLFVLTILILFILAIFRYNDIRLLESVPYATEALRVFTFTLIVNFIANIVRIIIVSRHRNHHGISSEERDNFTIGVGAVVTTVTVFALAVWFFSFFNIAFRDFLTSIALFSVGLAMIFQDIIKNYLYGLQLMFSNDFLIDDYVQVGEYPKGIIRDISFSATKLRTDEGNILFIPNHIVYTKEVVNYSKAKFKRIVARLTLSKVQLGDIELFEVRLLRHMKEHFPDDVTPEKSYLRIREMHKDGIVLHFETSVSMFNFTLENSIQKAAQTFTLSYRK